jgi:hypothetical protein
VPGLVNFTLNVFDFSNAGSLAKNPEFRESFVELIVASLADVEHVFDGGMMELYAANGPPFGGAPNVTVCGV